MSNTIYVATSFTSHPPFNRRPPPSSPSSLDGATPPLGVVLVTPASSSLSSPERSTVSSPVRASSPPRAWPHLRAADPSCLPSPARGPLSLSLVLVTPAGRASSSLRSLASPPPPASPPSSSSLREESRGGEGRRHRHYIAIQHHRAATGVGDNAPFVYTGAAARHRTTILPPTRPTVSHFPCSEFA
jgi:hypothetical protein